MNKKTKNIVSVLQSMSAAVLCTLCTVLFLASCNDESLVDNPHAQNAFRTVSVDLGMPQGKPAYGDGTDSRAQMADTTATGYRLSFDTAETGKPDASRAGSNVWIDGDKLLLHIVASNADPNSPTTEGMLTLTYSDSKWSLDEVNSYTKYGASFVAYNSTQPKLLITDDDTNINLANLKMQVDEKIGMSANVTATLFYAPHMKWILTEGSVTLVVDETASTYEKWEWTNTNTNSSWTTPYARLRVNTGAAGDVVTLTSSAFDSAWEVEPTEGEGENAKTVYTATTDDEGNAYFYGITNGDAALTDNFLVELTQMRVPVPQPAPRASEGRSVALDNAKENVIITLDTPITLLEASDVVPVKLDATKAYRIEADVIKRTASAKANLSVIDGSCGITVVTNGLYVGTDDHVAAVKAQIETAVAMGISEFTVINQLAVYDQFSENTNALTVVGEAIRRIGAANSDARISLTLSDATMVIIAAFYQCTALQSVSASVAENIEPLAFYQCTALQSVLAPAATAIGDSAFDGCSSLQSVSLGNVTTISSNAFQNTQVTNLNFDYLTVLGSDALSGLTFSNLEIAKEAASDAYIDLHQKAFRGCTLTGSVTFHKVVYESGNYDGLTQKNAFEGVATSELDLFLHAEQPIDQISVSNDGKLMWAGAEWASITVGETEYTAVGDVLCSITNGVMTTVIDDVTYGVIDGQDEYSVTKGILDKALALEPAITNFYVVNELKPLDSNQGTHLGEAIKTINTNITLKLADATSVPANAFNGCTALASVSFEKSVTIGDYAFMTCTALTGMDWSKVTSIGGRAFYNTGLTGTLSLPNVTSIGDYAFKDCDGLTGTLSLPEVTSIGNYAFKGCAGLTGLLLPKVTLIGDEAFNGCTGLTGSLSLPKVTEIGYKAFQKCTALKEVTFSVVTKISADIFYGCTNLTSITLGAEITDVNNDAFTGAAVSNCDLELAAGQSGVTTENGKLMWAGAEWKSITMGDRVYTQMNGFVQLEKDNVTYAVIDGSLTDSQAVNNQVTTALAAGIYNLYVANGLAVASNLASGIGTYVGDAISQLTVNYNGQISLLLDNQITAIPNSAFSGCNALQSVSAPGVNKIGNAAFQNDANLTYITFHTVVTEVGEYAFSGGNDWTKRCILTIAQGQEVYGELNVGYSGEWCGFTWYQIKWIEIPDSN